MLTDCSWFAVRGLLTSVQACRSWGVVLRRAPNVFRSLSDTVLDTSSDAGDSNYVHVTIRPPISLKKECNISTAFPRFSSQPPTPFGAARGVEVMR